MKFPFLYISFSPKCLSSPSSLIGWNEKKKKKFIFMQFCLGF